MSQPAAIPSFDSLATSYNFQTLPGRIETFVGLLEQELARFPRPVRAADVGCGSGIGMMTSALAPVRAKIDDFWGIEPDAKVQPAPGVFDHFQHALMETAELPENSFHLIYCSMVMEHVADPERFLRAVHRALAPGGSFMFLTINGAHYFARCAAMARAIRLEEAVLRLVRGREAAEEYHYPTVYRFNLPRTIDGLAARTGFEKPEYVFMEGLGPAPYLRGPLRPVLWTMQAKRRYIRRARALMELIGRLRKPGAPTVPTGAPHPNVVSSQPPGDGAR